MPAQQERRVFKAKRALTIQKTYRSWKDYETGDIVIGEIIGSHYSDKSRKFGPIVKVLDCTFAGEKSSKYVDKNLVLNPAGMLNKALKQIGFDCEEGNAGDSMGQVIQVTYNGSAEIAKGNFKGEEAHTMDVQVVEADNGDSEEEEVDL
jgi:hypothetical protein